MAIRVVLASASPARLATLRAAGLAPEVVVSGVDETQISDCSPADLACRLAELKADTVAARLPMTRGTTIVIGCDSVLELDGQPYGKPETAAEAAERWRLMRGRVGTLHTGHRIVLLRGQSSEALTRGAATTVHFANVTDAEIDAYVATGEPLAVAGAFTVDGLGGPFVTRVEGDYHNVVGVSLPLLREMLIDLGIGWTSLWSEGAAG